MPPTAAPEICMTACGSAVITWVPSACAHSVRFTLPLYNLAHKFDE